MPRARKLRPLCAWCGIMRVKLMKNECCDESCAASLRWERMKEAGRIKTFEKASDQARQGARFKRMQEKFEESCKELGIEPTPAIRALFVRAINSGYHAGYMMRDKRAKNDSQRINGILNKSRRTEESIFRRRFSVSTNTISEHRTHSNE